MDNEVCSSCGAFVASLNELTGWCNACSYDTPGPKQCSSCGSLFAGEPWRKLCGLCRKELWYKRNARHLEEAMLAGYTLENALIQVLEDNRPQCIICGKSIKGAKNGALFCNNKQACRTAARYFRYLLYEKQVKRAPALERTLVKHGRGVVDIDSTPAQYLDIIVGELVEEGWELGDILARVQETYRQMIELERECERNW